LDILVMSSRWEGLPITLLEGMAASRAIVTTAVPGILDVVESDKTALTVPPADATALAQACLSLLADPSRRAELGSNALQTVREKFSIHAMIDQTALVYETALTQQGISFSASRMGAV
jgi:glycosyltransferase involved in cell wall biosynthesis